ncbi:MAG: PilN domain-containing protein [Pseudomonadota bacterium]
MAKINLLPWREEVKRQRQQLFGVHMFLGVAAAAVCCVMYQSQINTSLNHQKSRNTYLSSEITKLQAELTEISELESTKTQLLDRMEIIQNLQTQRPQVVHTFQELAVAMPDGLYLQSVRQNGTALKVVGQAESNGSVSEFMRKLDASEWLGKPTVQVIENGHSSELRKFELSLSQTTPNTTEDEFDPTATQEYQELLGIGNNLDLGTDSMDLGSDPLDLGSDPMDLGTDPLDLSTDPMDLSNDPLDLSADNLDLSPTDSLSDPLALEG